MLTHDKINTIDFCFSTRVNAKNQNKSETFATADNNDDDKKLLSSALAQESTLE